MSDRETGVRPTRAIAALFLSALWVSAYHLYFQSTKPSPVQHLAAGERWETVSWTILLAVLVTLLMLPVALGLDALAVRRRATTPWGTVAGCSFLSALGLLAFLDNFLYSLAGIGLRTEDGLVVYKALVGVLVLCVGLLLGRAAARLKPRTVTVLLVALPVLTVPSLAGAALGVSRSETPEVPEAGGERTPLNVLVLSSDGIDARHMSVYGYDRATTPFLDSVADEVAVFDNAYANNGNTTGSIVSLLTGRPPTETGVVYPPDALSARDARRSLPFLLGREGYHRSNWAVPHYSDARAQNLLDAFDVDNGYRQARSPVTHLPLGAGPARWFVTETVESSGHLLLDLLGVEEMTNPYAAVETVVGDVLGDEGRLDAVEAEIRRGGPFFVNTHFMVTHGPVYHPERRVWSSEDEEETPEPWGTDAYDDAILEFDGYVRRVWQVLEETGELDDTIVVVTSDHGQEYDARERVPLLVRFPDGSQAGHHEVNVSRADVAPTVLDAVGLEQPDWMPGMSLLRPDEIPDDREIVAPSTYTRAFTRNMGIRPAGGALLLTAVRCRWWVQVTPDEDVTTGEVQGSTSTCDDRPEPPQQGSVP